MPPIAPAAADREELAAWKKRLFPNIPRLVRPRLYKMPVSDWADPRDIAYRRFKRKLPQAPRRASQKQGRLSKTAPETIREALFSFPFSF